MKTLTLWNRAEMLAGIGAWEWDIEHDQWHFTDGCRRIHGFPDHPTLTLGDLKACAYPADISTIENTLAAALAGQAPFENEHRTVRRHTGEIRWVRMWGEVDFDQQGKPIRLSGVSQDITERKQAEEVLKVNLAKYASLFESAPIGITVTDQQGKILEANLAAERLLSVPRTEHAHRTTDAPEWAIVRPDGSPMPAAEYASVRALTEDRLIENVEMGIVKATGTTTWLSVNAIPIRLPGYGVIITYTDISARRQAENALAASEARLKAIIENSSSNIWSIDREYRLLAGNGAFERNVAQWIGRKLEPGETVLEPNFSPAAAAFWRPLYDRALAGENFVIEMPSGLRRDRTLECRLNPIRDTDGNITGVAGQTFDITDRLATEKDLRKALQYQKLAADAADIGIWNWNFVDDSLDWDDRMCELYAIPKETRAAGIYYDVWRSRVHPDDLEIAEQALHNFSDSSITFRTVLPNGQIRHIYSAYVVERNQQGEPVRMIGINRDVTAQKLYEQLLEDANLELESRVAKRTAELESALLELRHANDAKDAFLNSISHELRTPLSGVLTMADVLEMQTTGVLNPSQLRYVGMIRDSGDRLLKLVDSVLHYTALIGGRVRVDPAPCRLVELGAIALHEIRGKVESKQLTVQFAVDPLDLEIISDANDLLPVLNRLLDNAVKFTPAGGRIGLVVGRDADHTAATLTVWDTGIGIAPEHQMQIFTPFHQVDHSLSREYEGVGLGLAYAHAMVALLDGTIAVESELGKGSRFTVTVPVKPL